MLLSICMPTYNRHAELSRFFDSLDQKYSDIFEVVICDDGSTDASKDLILQLSKIYNIKYIFQENSGRSIALRNSIINASGKYCILMDSDDYFLPNAFIDILKGIDIIESDDLYGDVNSLLFGVKIIKGKDIQLNVPSGGVSNFIKVKADEKIIGDLKQLVRTDDIKSVMYNFPSSCRRVPTSLLWSKLSNQTNCYKISTPIAVKEYLPGGMTDKILVLKTKYSEPMLELYELLANSDLYNSRLYRYKCMLLWGRHAFHNGFINPKYYWQYLAMIPGFFIYLFDKLRLKLFV